MPLVNFSNRDVLMSTLVEPAWYRVQIESVGEEPAKVSNKGPSTNYPVEATILFNGDNGSTKFKDVPLKWNFNSKAMGFAVGYLECFGVKVKPGQPIELAASEGRTLDVYVEHKEWEGRIRNNVNHKYRLPRPDVTPRDEPSEEVNQAQQVS